MKRNDWMTAAVIFATAIFVRVIALDADPPPWLSWSAGIFSDEGIYANDARLWSLYHQHMIGNFHSAAIAPLQNLIDVLWFKHFGVSLKSLRMISVLFSLATIVVVWLAVRIQNGLKAAHLAAAIVGISAPFVMYNRLGLLETPALFWLTTGYLAIVVAETMRNGRLATLGICGVLAGIAVVWKGTFILGATAFLIYAIWAFRAQGLATLAGFFAVILIYYLKWYMPHQEELARVDQYYLLHQYLPHSVAGVWGNIKRGVWTGDRDGILPYLAYFNPFITLFALFAINKTIRSRTDLLLWLWLIIPGLSFMLLNYTPSRYYLILLLPLAILAAKWMSALPNKGLALASIAVFIQSIFPLCLAYHDRTYTMRDDSAILEQHFEKDSYFAGQFAPSLCLNNGFRDFYIQPGLANDTLADLQNMPITHVLATKTEAQSADPWQGRYRYLIYGPAGIRSLPLGKKFTVNVYANSFALP